MTFTYILSIEAKLATQNIQPIIFIISDNELCLLKFQQNKKTLKKFLILSFVGKIFNQNLIQKIRVYCTFDCDSVYLMK